MKNTDKNSVMSPLELVLLNPENVSVLGPIERWELAVDERTPVAALRLLCLEDTEGQLSHEIANNPNSPEDVIQLAEVRLLSNKCLRKTVGEVDNPYVLEGLASNKDWIIRRFVANHLKTPLHVLTTLANDNSEYVRIAVAGNRNTPPEVLDILASDETEQVRSIVASNPTTSSGTFRKLAADENASIRRECRAIRFDNLLKIPIDAITKFAAD